MRYVVVGLIGVALGVGGALLLRSQDEPAAGDAARRDAAIDLSTDDAIAAYSIGYDLSTELEFGLSQDGVEADAAAILAGFEDGLANRPPRADAATMSRVLAALHERVMAAAAPKMMEADPRYKKLCEDNLAASKAYMAANAGRDGVKSLEKGVQYEVLESGDAAGATPSAADVVVCTYTGRLIDETEFAEDTDARFRVGDATAGAQIALSHMRPGDRWRVVIPPELAHGPSGKPPLIGPNEALVFDVRLIAVNPRD